MAPPLSVPAHVQAFGADGRLAARDQIGQQLCAAAGHGPAQRAVTGVQVQVLQRGGAHQRRTDGRHRAQAGPEQSPLQIATRKKLARDFLARGAAARVQAQIKTHQLGHAPHTDAVAQAGQRDLVGLVQHRRLRCQHIAVSLDRLHQPVRIGQLYTVDAAAIVHQGLHAAAGAQQHAQGSGTFGQLACEEVTVAGFVVGQTQATGDRGAGAGQCRLHTDHCGGVQQLERHAAILQHRHVASRGVELGLAAKQLQGAATALVIGDARLGAPRPQAVAAVFRQAHHALLVDGIAPDRAVGQHGRHPAPLEQGAIGPNRQRRMGLEQPAQGLDRDAGCGPGGRISRRDLTSIGKTGFHDGIALPLDHRHLGALTGQRPGGGHPDHTTPQHHHFHARSLNDLRFSDVMNSAQKIFSNYCLIAENYTGFELPNRSAPHNV